MIHVDESDPVGELEPPFPYRDVTIKRGTDIKESFELLTEIGRGKFGTVYKCREKATGLELAAKKVPVKKREERRTVEREVDIMKRLRHPRLIQLYDAYDSGSFMYVVLELITGGELFERVIDDDFVLTEKACTVFMRQICEGIEFVHQQNILHLDMKPENILCLTKTGNRIKIIDFGLARQFDPEKKLQVLFGTPEFVAPEVVNFDQIGFGTDMWSVGVICYVLLSGLSPFMGETDIETMANVTVAKYDYEDEAFNEISDDAKDFIRKLLIKDKESRMTASQCVRHSWLVKKPPKSKPPKSKTPIEKSKLLKEQKKNKEEKSVSPVEELDMTKDNLRLFVERWSEHPNSPYIFDKSNHEITHCLSNSNRHAAQIPDYENSVAGCSPSPCGSLNSSPDNIYEENLTNNCLINDENKNGKTRLTVSNLERRASDSSCFIHKKADICLRVNLAEEIKKLSDHLFMLSTMNTDIENKTVENDKTKTVSSTATISQTSGKQTLQPTEQNGDTSVNKTTLTGSIKSSFVSQTSSNEFVGSNLPWTKPNRTKFKMTGMNRDVPIIDKKQTSFGDEFNRRRESINKFISSNSEENENYTVQSSNTTSQNIETTNNVKTVNSSMVKNSTFLTSSSSVKFNGTTTKSKITNGFNASSSSKISKSNQDNSSTVTNGFKNGDTSLENTSKHFYKKDTEESLPNAHRTKDLLLSLLDQWDENQMQSQQKNNVRHKSVSMEWSESDSLAQKSLNSLNSFYNRQTTTSETVKKKHDSILKANGLK